mmetsp:Transcript_69546/g.226528  ORF Transcript_69546/g.226528 Transcript_69546/m.226528 type:complete len:154 (-) Transcript_69546:191-652(-)
MLGSGRGIGSRRGCSASSSMPGSGSGIGSWSGQSAPSSLRCLGEDGPFGTTSPSIARGSIGLRRQKKDFVKSVPKLKWTFRVELIDVVRSFFAGEYCGNRFRDALCKLEQSGQARPEVASIAEVLEAASEVVPSEVLDAKPGERESAWVRTDF